MDSLKEMNEALNYIEGHLTQNIDFKKVAELAHCSEYHFSRMFSFLAGITLSEYIRRRRLTLAAFELRDSQVKVIDVAIKHGYNSPDSFTRAFQNVHGLTPSDARNTDQVLKAYPRMTFQLSIQGGDEMNYRIVKKEAFNIVGIMDRIPIVFNGENPGITAMGERLNAQLISELKEISNVEPIGLLSASTNFSESRMEEKGELDYYIGVATTKEVPKHLAKLEVAPSTWAIFEVIGSSSDAQEMWGRVFSEWFPSSNYELAEGPELYWYEDNKGTPSHFKNQIWIPVVNKDKS
ncbi:AraC family transcriptional regulator [Pullulanibacillus pueri]|uniref:AraC family transcriptional regulator n=1 Tax=Pullulanibacillus pueri TaxID=1437324 RepID=A0A8J3ELD7_9BACL|nr:AraC family transcriptional regulator [Pullulanibacillus pueri]MBM7682234.1 AraC family transcriptional regulator [Pullulanibacillus pueri]GGH80553.1 AraC family transcriptional regulator [Pullulanibacillus pueri]